MATELKKLTVDASNGSFTFDVVDAEARERIGDLSKLKTTDKSSLVGAINEVAKTGSKYPDWSHLTWYVMGDSLTDRKSKNAQGVPFTNKYYYDFVKEKTGIKIIVDGIGGTGYINNMNGKCRTFLERVQDIDPAKVDIVTIFGSGNDLKSTDFNYAKDAIWRTMHDLLKNKPGLRVIVVPPAPWRSTDTHDYTKWNELWKTYCDNLELCAFKCNHRYLSDMYDCPPYFPNMDGHMKKFFTTDPNGVHPNEEGHKAMAPYFYNALLQELALKV